MNQIFAEHVRRQLDVWHHEIRYAEKNGMTEEARIFRAQAAAYRMGLEAVLNSRLVERIFEGYDFGGDEA